MEPSQTSQTHMVGKTAHEPKRRMLKPSAGFVNMVMIVFAGGPADMNEVLVSVQVMNSFCHSYGLRYPSYARLNSFCSVLTHLEEPILMSEERSCTINAMMTLLI